LDEKRIEIRWRDLDAYAHVNQAVYQTYVEEAVDHWLRGVLGISAGEVWHYVAAHVAIDYRSELRLTDREAVLSCRLERLGTRSVTIGTEIQTADGRLAAEAETVIVPVEGPDRASRELTADERAAFERA
jgi:acyl-CoA thioester hydrolase